MVSVSGMMFLPNLNGATDLRGISYSLAWLADIASMTYTPAHCHGKSCTRMSREAWDAKLATDTLPAADRRPSSLPIVRA
jgi:hypothetical protein